MDKNNLAESASEAQMQNQQNRDQQYAVRGHHAQDRHGHLSVDSATYKTDSTGAYVRLVVQIVKRNVFRSLGAYRVTVEDPEVLLVVCHWRTKPDLLFADTVTVR